jgi:hypothetical protein
MDTVAERGEQPCESDEDLRVPNANQGLFVLEKAA